MPLKDSVNDLVARYNQLQVDIKELTATKENVQREINSKLKEFDEARAKLDVAKNELAHATHENQASIAEKNAVLQKIVDLQAKLEVEREQFERDMTAKTQVYEKVKLDWDQKIADLEKEKSELAQKIAECDGLKETLGHRQRELDRLIDETNRTLTAANEQTRALRDREAKVAAREAAADQREAAQNEHQVKLDQDRANLDTVREEVEERLRRVRILAERNNVPWEATEPSKPFNA